MRSSYWPMPDQARFALPDAPFVKLPASVGMPLSDWESRKPSFLA